MATAMTNLRVINMALRHIGQQQIVAYPEVTATERGGKAAEHFESVRDATLVAHPWNFAITRAKLYSYTEPDTTLTPGAASGSGVTFTAGAAGTFYAAGASLVDYVLIEATSQGRATIVSHPATQPAQTLTPAATTGTGITFTAGGAVFTDPDDIGKVLRDDTGDGIATIVSVTNPSTVVADINTDFASTSAIASGDWSMVQTDAVVADITTTWSTTAAIASGDWQLENPPPAWGFSHSITKPSDMLRLWRVGDDENEGKYRYQVEGDYIVADVAELRCRYIKREEDPTKWSQLFVRALQYHLAAVLADGIVGLDSRVRTYWDLYQNVLRQARTVDGMEGSTERLFPDTLVAVRRSGSTGIVGPRIPY